jgi:predicted nuclease of predicted toxin-antitoxin system
LLILLDQNIARAVAKLLPGHDVRSAADQGWQELTNGELLKAAEEAGFTAIITADKNIRYQQNLTGRKIALVVLSTNTWQVLRENAALLAEAVIRARSGGYEEVGFPRPPLRRRAPTRRPEPG